MSNTLKLGNGKWATGKDTLLSFSDTNNNYKPLAFSFSRDSSGTVINKAGLIETVGSGEPRIDFKDNTKGALLLEPQRSNVLPYSEDFSQWGLDGGTQSVTPNYAVSPDGTQNAYRLQLDKTGVSYSRMYLDAGTIGEKTSSIWIKSNNNSTQNVGLRYDGVGVNLEITSVWKRFELTATSITVSRFQVILFDSIAGNDESCDIQIYAAQLEQGSYATSYIPTNGSAVTRVADSSSQTVPDSVIGQTEGTVFLDFKPQTLDGTSRYLSIENSNSVGSGWMGVFASLVSGTIRFRFYGDGWDIDSSLIIEKDTRYKIAFSYKNGVQTSIYVNGNLLNNITASLSGKSYQKIRLSEAAIGVRGDADFKDIKLYDARLTDQELIALTS